MRYPDKTVLITTLEPVCSQCHVPSGDHATVECASCHCDVACGYPETAGEWVEAEQQHAEDCEWIAAQSKAW